MQLTKIDRSQAQPDIARKGYFDGEVKTIQLVGSTESNEIELLAVYFSSGARTIPHISAMCHISIKRPGPSNWEAELKNWESGYDN